MVWNTNWPDGTKPVNGNTVTGQQNTTYTETELNKDHFWNIGIDEDGRHKQMNTVASNDATPSSPINAQLASGMDLVIYSRIKTAAESVAQQDPQAFIKNIEGLAPNFSEGVMQVLGIRAMALFTVTGVQFEPPNLLYAHNIAVVNSATPATSGLDYQAVGRYEIRYANALPSNNYLVLGGAIKNSLNTAFEPIIGSVASGANPGARKNTNGCVVVVSLPNGTLIDPLQAWFIMFGG